MENLDIKVKEIENAIYEYLPKEEGFQKTVIEAMNYSMMAGGKRIRPLLMEQTYRLFEDNPFDNNALKSFMAAIEMIHTYSLVHDDLPAMDDDDFRRGRKTTHIVYGEAMAILAGDGLLNYAYEVAMKSFEKCDNVCSVIEAMKVLVRKPGLYGMLGGQAVDVENDDKSLDKDTLDFIYELKTGALIEASMMIGAILGGADTNQIELIEQAAKKIGMAFQIQDDILDVTSTTTELGKPVNSDEKNNKTTYVTIYGVKEASKLVKQYSDEAIELISQMPVKNEFLNELIMWMVYRKK
jgi:geranylgeranyl diphosphate synthase type II